MLESSGRAAGESPIRTEADRCRWTRRIRSTGPDSMMRGLSLYVRRATGCCRTSMSPHRSPGRRSAIVGPTGIGQVDADCSLLAAAASTRRPARCSSTASDVRDIRVVDACAAPSCSSRRRSRSCSRTRSPTTSRSDVRRSRTGGSRVISVPPERQRSAAWTPGASRTARERRRRCATWRGSTKDARRLSRRARHAGGRARHHAVGRPEAAHRAGACAGHRSARADPGRCACRPWTRTRRRRSWRGCGRRPAAATCHHQWRTAISTVARRANHILVLEREAAIAERGHPRRVWRSTGRRGAARKHA